MSSIHNSRADLPVEFSVDPQALRETLNRHIMQTEESAKGAAAMSFREDQDDGVLEMILRAAARGEQAFRESEGGSYMDGQDRGSNSYQEEIL